MDTPRLCPACAQPDALIALGERADRSHRWRPWIMTITHLYLCRCCDAIVSHGEAHPPAVESVYKGGGSQGFQAARRMIDPSLRFYTPAAGAHERRAA